MAIKASVVESRRKRAIIQEKRAPVYSASAMAEMLHPMEAESSSGRKAGMKFSSLMHHQEVGKTRRKYVNDAAVFVQGTAADAVFYVQSGRIKLTVLSKRGKEVVVAILSETSFFGEGCLTGQALRLATATTVQPSIILRMEKSAMLRLLRDEPDFAARFLAYLLSRNVRMESDLVDHLFNNSEKRLARLLLLLANYGQNSKSKPVIAQMSQETLAKMIGTTRSRVSFFLNRFREMGFITYNGGIHIHSSLVSVLLHD
jgi:CRP/FNR family cyclic AMP-dependent transcriptional regulator